jgi:hypothetical protein
MKNSAIVCKALTWLMALSLAALVAGCGSGGGENGGAVPGDPPTAAGAGTGVNGAGRGPAPVALGTAGGFAILSVATLSNVATSVVTGTVGLTGAGGSAIGLSCAEVNGTIYRRDSTGPNCMQTNAALLSGAKADGDAAFYDAMSRSPDYIELGAGDIGGLNLGPATYKWSNAVQLTADLTLTGGPNDVWIFQIAQQLDVSPGVRIILRGGALAQNVYWAPTGTVTLEAASQFNGILVPAAPVFMHTGASVSGRLLAEGVHLEQNTVTQPAQ